MLYVKALLAGIAGGILAIILCIAVVVVLNVRGAGGGGMVGFSFIYPLALAVVGFALAFYWVLRNSN